MDPQTPAHRRALRRRTDGHMISIDRPHVSRTRPLPEPAPSDRLSIGLPFIVDLTLTPTAINSIPRDLDSTADNGREREEDEDEEDLIVEMEKREASATRPPNPAMPYREDCWSEGETSSLVDAWGDRYIELNRGNLRQKQWQEVADAVNSRRGAGRRPARTDVQCKNRIDTLKKKYKVEKSRVAGSGESQWPFFSRLDALVGSAPPPTSKKQSVSPPLAVALPFHRKASALPVASAVRPAETKKRRTAVASSAVDNPFFRRAAAAAAAAAAATEDDDDVDEDEEEEEQERSGSLSRSSSRSGRDLKREREEDGSGIRELAKAIMKFAEIYERVEESKQRQMIELEKQRMEFAKALEFQKMQIVVDSQVQLAKIKRAKRSDTDSYS